MKKLFFFLFLAATVGITAEAQIVYDSLLTFGTNQLLYASHDDSEVSFRTTITPMGDSYKFEGVTRVIAAKNNNWLGQSQLFFLEMDRGGWYLVAMYENNAGKLEAKFFASGYTGQVPQYFRNANFFTEDIQKGEILMRIFHVEGDSDITDMMIKENQSILKELIKTGIVKS